MTFPLAPLILAFVAMFMPCPPGQAPPATTPPTTTPPTTTPPTTAPPTTTPPTTTPPTTAPTTTTTAPEPTGEPGTIAVDIEPVVVALVEGFDVTLRFYDQDGDLVAEREWSDVVPQDGNIETYYRHVHHETVPAGANRMVSFMRVSAGGPIPPPSGPGCETPVDVGADDGVRVTLLFAPDDRGACASLTSATLEADFLLAMPYGLPASGIVGLTEAQAEADAAARGWSVRVVARDGEGFARTEDFVETRVNLVIDEGTVIAAARG